MSVLAATMHGLRTGPDFFSPRPRPLVYFVGATIVFARPVRTEQKKVTMTNRNRDTTFSRFAGIERKDIYTK